MKSGDKVLYVQEYPDIEHGKIIKKTEKFEVRVMAIAEGYAKVRRKGAPPFVCSIDKLEDISHVK